MKAFAVLLLAMLAGLWLPLPVAAEEPMGQKMFPQTPDVVWPALMDVLVELNYPVKTMDRSTFFVNTDGLIFGDPSGTKKKISTGPRIFLGIWSQCNASLQIKLSPKEGGTKVTIVSNIQAFESNVMGIWYQCPSNGTLEQVVFEHLEATLKDRVAPSLDPAAPAMPPGTSQFGDGTIPNSSSLEPQPPQTTPPQKPLTNEDIIKMVVARLEPEIIITKILSDPCAFDTTSDGLIALSAAAVPKEVIKAMIETSRR